MYHTLSIQIEMSLKTARAYIILSQSLHSEYYSDLAIRSFLIAMSLIKKRNSLMVDLYKKIA